MSLLASCQSDREASAALPTLMPTIAGISQFFSPTPSLTPILPTNTPTPPPTFTPIPSITNTPTPGPSPTPSNTATATATFIPPTYTPTSIPQRDPHLENFTSYAVLDGQPTPTPPTPIPTAVPTFELPEDTTNILLLGNDADQGSGFTRTDTIIIVSVNSKDKTASMLSLPRDLYVHIPGWTMSRINQAYTHGEIADYPGGGIKQLEDTILYNFGIPIHYYARINFEGFKDIVDAIGGLEMAVSCPLTDWRLKSPELDQEDEDNWERFTLEQGIHTMDGNLALWYARSRLSTSDYDRNRRQQQLLRAILNQGVDLGLVTETPTLWQAFNDTVETDMDIGRILQFATIAQGVRENGVQHLHLVFDDLYDWTIPNTEATVTLPNWDSAQETFQRLFTPPSLNQSNRTPIFIEIINHSGDEDLGALAVDNLAWYGFFPVLVESDDDVTETNTQITYYGNNFKGSYDWLVSWVFDQRKQNITLNSEDTSEYDYQIVLGENYNPCRPQRYNPREHLTE